MPATVESILSHLEVVAREREARAGSPQFSRRVEAIKTYQQRRFSHTYHDLLAAPRYAGAARFFLDELYGPGDFSQRDAQFARVVPALVRLFPHDVVETVNTLAQLHALSERLDSEMAHKLALDVVTGEMYVAAWQAVGRSSEREMQIELTLSVGQSLDELTRRPLLRHTLRMMRSPARAAGLAALQHFLESGFDTFRAMRGAKEFLAIVSTREHELVEALFNHRALCAADGRMNSLGQLP